MVGCLGSGLKLKALKSAFYFGANVGSCTFETRNLYFMANIASIDINIKDHWREVLIKDFDFSALKTVKNYAQLKGVSTSAVYNWISKGKVYSVEIDGVKFIII